MAGTESGAHLRIVHRKCGGVLALSPDGDALQIGVVASTEEEARDRFSQSRARCIELLACERDALTSAGASGT